MNITRKLQRIIDLLERSRREEVVVEAALNEATTLLEKIEERRDERRKDRRAYGDRK